MSITPTLSIAAISNLSDVLKEIPLVTPIDYYVEEDDNANPINLFDNQQHMENSIQLMNSTDRNIVDLLSKALSQIDTSKITLKPSSEFLSSNNNSKLSLPPILQATLITNPKLFNGFLNEQTTQLIQQQQQQQQQQKQNYLNQQLKQPTQFQAGDLASSSNANSSTQQQQQILQPTHANNYYTESQNLNKLAGIKNDVNFNSMACTSGLPSTSSSSSSLSPAKIQQVVNEQYTVMPGNDLTKVSVKVPKLTPEQISEMTNKTPTKIKETSEPVAASKFYSKQTAPNTTPNQDKEVNKSSGSSKKESSNSNRKKTEKPATKNNLLGTWQANLTSQLFLPADFTPELISQLASEGYDVVSAGNRKARSRQQSALVNSINSVVESSSEDEYGDADFGSSSVKNPAFKNRRVSSNNDEMHTIANKQKSDWIKSNTRLDCQDPSENPSFKRFNQILEDLLDSYEQDLQQISRNRNSKFMINADENENVDTEIPPEYLLSRQLCSDLVQEAFKLNSYSIMNLIRKENLVKLQNLLFFNIKDGLRSLNLGSEESNGNNDQDRLLKEILIEKLLRASDCSIISLIIMTSEKMSKELIVEDIIEQISLFVKIHLTETIFPFYDSVYKTHSSATDSTGKAGTNPKRKIANQFGTSGVNSSSIGSASHSFMSKSSKNMQHFYNRMREILCLIGELICQIDLTDTIIITLSSLSVMCFFVENINDLQLESLKILTNIFTRYSKHRQLVLDDILSSLIKLHTNKRSSRLYKCLNGDSIQMFSALLLQLIQCEVTPIDNFNTQRDSNLEVAGTESENGDGNSQKNELTFEEKESYLINSYENSSQTARKFLSVFFSKCKTKQADSDFRPIFENFIQDLLTTVNKPEWPVSEIILNLLGIILVSQIQNEQNDVGSRVNSLEYLGQIVAQLRKDSLEYQKFPDKVRQVLNKINPTTIVGQNKDNELFNLQKSLVQYVDTLVESDPSLQYSKFFLVGQWLKELNQNTTDSNAEESEHGQERVNKQMIAEENRKRLYSLIETNSHASSSSNVIQLDMSEAFILSKYLCSLKKSLDKNFDYYLVNILSLSGGGSESSIPTQVRSKAIKCLSSIIEADPQILLKQKVFSCVEANFLHQTISVREASVDLIGRFITLRPDLTNHYYKLLSARILDVGVSVRKRAIKIFRDVCLNQPDFAHLSETCFKILRRINDEENIRKLVIDTFYMLWFSPINNNDLLRRRVLNIVDVVSEFNMVVTNQQSSEIFEQLFSSLIITPGSNSSAGGSLINGNANSLMTNVKDESGMANGTSSNSTSEQDLEKAREVVKSCKQIVDCLIENVLNTEANTSSPQAYKRLVASFSTLYLLSKIKPENFINHAETLLPYLNIKSTNANDNQIINSAAKILECVIPLLQSPSNSFLISLEESLCKLIFQGGMLIVSSCISCLGTVVNKLTKNYKLAADCFSKYYKTAANLKKNIDRSKPLEQNTKPYLFRMLFTLGLLSKYFDIESDELIEYKVCSKQELFSMFIYFIKGFDADIQHKALIGLGSFLSRYSEFMMKDEVKNLYQAYIKSPNVPIPLKSQVFLNLTDYLNEEDQKNLAKSVELSKGHCKDDLKEMLDVQSGMASTIIQSYLKPILESYITPNQTLRINVFNCLSMILNQGLVYPIECVPYLIAMTTDLEKKIQSKSLIHLTNLQKAHPGFVQSKSIAGINVSFLLQNTIKKSQLQSEQSDINNTTNGVENANNDSVIRGFSEIGEVLSLNHHLYSLLRINRSYRRAFLQQLVKMFDDSTMHHASLSHKLFICDNLAYFPYQLYDEPLYLIHQIDIIISVTGINLLQTFKENLLNHQVNDENSETKVQFKKEQLVGLENQLIDFDVNQDCPDEADDKANIELAKQNEENSKNEVKQNTVKKAIDDDEETFDTVFNNLPPDLKPLKDCMYKAQGCCLLLILKLFLKEIYSISESKIQNYSPTDTAKVNERPITNRKTNRKFNPKQIINYMKKSELKVDENDFDFKQSLVQEYLEFKELMLSIDQEEAKIDDNKTNNGNSNSGNLAKLISNDSKVSLIQQKLLDGIEKTKPSSSSTGLDSTNATPRKSTAKPRAKVTSSAKKQNKNKSKKRKKDSDCSSDESDSNNNNNNSDFDDEDL